MAKLTWMNSGTRFFETGIGKGVLYTDGNPGVAWTGLTSVTERPTGGEAKPYYIDGVKFLNVSTAEEFEATITAYTYPDEFAPCNGVIRAHPGLSVTGQPRKSFGFSYKTKIGNDILKENFAYKIHLVYNALARPSDRSYKTLGGNIETADFTWEITTRPPRMAGYKRTAHLEIDSRYTNPETMTAIEDILYGTDVSTPRLPELAELITLFNDLSTFSVIDHGDGSFTVSGPDEMIHMTGADTFEIVSDSVTVIDSDSYSVSSL